MLTQSASTADYFERVAEATGRAKVAANWVMGPAQALMNVRGEDARTFAVPPGVLGEVIGLVLDGTVSDAVGRTVLEAVARGEGSPREIIAERGLEQVRDEDRLEGWVSEVLEGHPDEAERVRAGERKLLGFLVGQVMRRSRGTADPRRVNELLRDRLT